MFKIEKEIPMPPSKTGRSQTQYPFAEMDMGDSFFVECTKEESGALQRKIATTGAGFRRRKGGGQHFATRQVEGGVRCWRTWEN